LKKKSVKTAIPARLAGELLSEIHQIRGPFAKPLTLG
jgi:hypothetical protein